MVYLKNFNSAHCWDPNTMIWSRNQWNRRLCAQVCPGRARLWGSTLSIYLLMWPNLLFIRTQKEPALSTLSRNLLNQGFWGVGYWVKWSKCKLFSLWPCSFLGPEALLIEKCSSSEGKRGLGVRQAVITLVVKSSWASVSWFVRRNDCHCSCLGNSNRYGSVSDLVSN